MIALELRPSQNARKGATRVPLDVSTGFTLTWGHAQIYGIALLFCVFPTPAPRHLSGSANQFEGK
jgi:hypothetical protein